MESDLRWAFIAWAPYSRRSQVFAKALGGTLHNIHYLRFQSPPFAPVKYILQAMHTWLVLFRERPDVVHVQNPPFVCGVVVYLYCLVTSARFVFDHHSAAFAPIWRRALPIQRFLARRAAANIVTNQHWADIIRSWDAWAIIMGDPFLPLPAAPEYRVKPGFTVGFISTFAPDEPTDAMIEAASELPDVHFYITGDVNRKGEGFAESLPENVTCTGFLPDHQYIGLLRSVDAIMVLTTRDYTLQLGGCEAVSLDQPLIISDWPFLREFFPQGAVYVHNTAAGIRQGVQLMLENRARLKQEMVSFHTRARDRWDAELHQLQALVSEARA
jgi:glycosyltransferase involved in cell wall biosynthesis